MSSWSLQGISCFSSEPDRVQSYWALESFKLIYELRVHALNVEVLLSKPDLMRLSRERLKNIHQKISEQIRRYEVLLSPLGWRKIEQAQFLSSLSMESGSSFLVKNIDNLFRDWCWGEEENKVALDRVLAAIRNFSLTNHDELLVLGAGASRLAYDLHQNTSFQKTISVDYNPLFHLIAQKMIKGEKLTLCEFPIVPSTTLDFAVDRELQAPSPVREGFELVLSDLTDPTFVWPQAKMILTPWLIDVISMDFSNLVKRINQALPVGGVWVNYGPLGFNDPQLKDYYSYEEVNHLVKKNGFQLQQMSYEFAPYLQSPSSNSHRLERVYTFAALKTEDVSGSTKEASMKTLPDWLVDLDAKITLPVQAMRLEEAFTFNAKVASLLKKNISFLELEEQLHQSTGVEKELLSAPLKHILLNFHQQSLLNPHDHD